MKSETEVKRAMVKDVKSQGGYARRIEDQYAVGILDTILALRGCPVVFAEVKLIKGNQFKPTDRQYVEMLAVDAAAAPCVAVLIGWKEGLHYFSPTTKVANINECYVQSPGQKFSAALRKYLTIRGYQDGPKD